MIQGLTTVAYSMYTALIWSAKNYALQPCWRVIVLLWIRASRTQNLCLLLYRYLFEDCYFDAIIRSAKIAKIKCL